MKITIKYDLWGEYYRAIAKVDEETIVGLGEFSFGDAKNRLLKNIAKYEKEKQFQLGKTIPEPEEVEI